VSRLKSSVWLSLFHKYNQSAEINVSSVAVAYYFLLSLFPMVMTIGSLLPYLNLNVAEIMLYAQKVVPEDIYNRFSSVIVNLLTQKSGGRLSLSVLATLWAASQGIGALQSAMTKAYGVVKTRNFLLTRLFGLLILVASLILFVLAMFVLTFGQNVLVMIAAHINLQPDLLDNLRSLMTPLALIGLFILLVLLNYLLPNVKFSSVKYLIPGSVITLVGFVILSKMFDLYTTIFGSKVSSYQIIGAVIILMIWLVFIAKIFLYGAVVNAVYMEKSTGKAPEVRQIRKWLKGKVEEIKY
jgi:membrane protein